MTAEAAKALVDDRALRSSTDVREMTDVFLRRIEERNETVGALQAPTPSTARADAERAQQARDRRTPLPLDGMPVVIKDNIDLSGVISTRGSRFFLDNVAESDATVVSKLRAAGAVMLGKAQSTELMFALAPHPDIEPCRNPWDFSRIPGASSSGSGAALADDQVIGALGTDTGGSVRIPAAFSGVSALRPTFGLVSNTGVFHIASSLDTVGPMARSVVDVAAIFEAIVGFDPTDNRSRTYEPERGLVGSSAHVRRVGVPEDFFFDDCDPEVSDSVSRGIEVLAGLGFEIVPIALENAELAHDGFTDLIRAEALVVHSGRLESDPDGFSVDVRDRLRMGQELTGRDVAQLFDDMATWKQELKLVFTDAVDFIVTPTVKCPPPRIEDARLGKLPDVTRYTYPWAFGHVPALSIPCGLSTDGLPIGMQLVARPHADWRLLELGRQFQSVTDWHTRRPPVNRDAG